MEEYVLLKVIKSNLQLPRWRPKIRRATRTWKRRWATYEAYPTHQTYENYKQAHNKAQLPQRKEEYLTDRNLSRAIKTNPKAYYSLRKNHTMSMHQRPRRKPSVGRVRKSMCRIGNFQRYFSLNRWSPYQPGNPGNCPYSGNSGTLCNRGTGCDTVRHVK